MQNTPGKKGILLINLGTPDSPAPKDVAAYLAEFLMDPYVIDIPWVARALLVYGLILPRRPFASSKAYKKIWSEKGSPLLFHTLELSEKVQERLGDNYLVIPAMRYGRPSIAEAIRVFKAASVSDIVALPLYPQYSLAATESSIVHTRKQLAGLNVPVRFVPPFYADAHYLDAVAAVSRKALTGARFDHFLFSFHGIPERQIQRLPGCDTFCSFDHECCAVVREDNHSCYRAQCFATARGVASRLGIVPDQFSVSFQSRLGRTPWIRPYTDLLLPEYPRRGIRRLAVFCPSFVADCLETLEEIQIRGRESFLEAGGEELRLIPSLNASDHWADAVSAMVRA